MISKGPISLSPLLPAVQTAPFEDDRQWKLFLTTSASISVWDSQGYNAVFTSGSKGIVAAKRAKDGSVLAIADSQVVVLHRIEEGQDKSYCLEGTQRCRHLLYGHDSRSLFFTDSIHSSVQSCSLKENRVADAAESHPSSITAFAVSSDSNLVISCSADPPIIQIHNRLIATTISIVPRSSSALVVNCIFHPSRRNIFVLAFGDGVLAAYDYSKIPGGCKAKNNGKAGVNRGSMKEIHAFQHLYDPGIAVSVGITGVQFIPGYRSRAVTVGGDGRLFLVDFELRDTLGSWHIGAPATSLTVRPIVPKDMGDDEDDKGGCVIAVGTTHGKCYVYDGNGNKIGEQLADADGGKILDVEWVYGVIHLPGVGGPAFSLSRSKLFPPPGSVAESRNTVTAKNSKSARTIDGFSIQKSDTGVGSQWPEAEETASQGYMKLFSPVKKKQKKPEKDVSLAGTKISNTEKGSDPKLKTLENEDQRKVISTPLRWNMSTKKQTRLENTREDHDQRNNGSPEEPKKPVLDKQPQYLEPSAQGSDTSNDSSSILAVSRVPLVAPDVIKSSNTTSDGKLLCPIRSVRAKVEGDRAVRGNFAIFAPYMSSKLKTSTVVRSGGATENRKISSPPQEKVLNSRFKALERVDGSGDETVPLGPQAEISHPGKEEELLCNDLSSQSNDESGTSCDGDIWLVEEKPSKGRKRKNSHADDFQASSSINSSVGERSNSRAGSSKSRKTVSLDDGLVSHNDIYHSSFESGPPSSPQLDVSSENSTPSMNVTGTRAGMVFDSASMPLGPASSKKPDNINYWYLPGPGSSSDIHTPNELVSRDTGGVMALDPAFRSALVEIQMMFKEEMKNMQVEIAKKFQVQRNVFEDLKNQMQLVREENEELRNQLFELSGSRGRAKRNQ